MAYPGDPRKGIGYGNHYLSSDLSGNGRPYRPADVEADLQKIWDMGFRRIRMAHADVPNAATWDSFRLGRQSILESIAVQAKDMGFYVICGVTGAGLNNGNWANYSTKVAEVATRLWNNGSPLVDEFSIGNELEFYVNQSSTGALSSVQDKVRTLATDIKTNNFLSDGITSFVSYAAHAGTADSNWLTNGKGGLDILGMNAYSNSGGDFDTFLNQFINVFGTHGFNITEWNMYPTWNGGFNNESNNYYADTVDQECVHIWYRNNEMRKRNVVNYFFIWRWDTAGDQYGLYNSSTGKYRKWKDVLVGRTPIYLTRHRRPDPFDHGYAHDPRDATRRCRRSGVIGGALNQTHWGMSMWVYPTSFTGAGRLWDEGNDGSVGTAGGFQLSQTGDKILVSLSTSTGSKINNLSSEDCRVQLFRWNHIFIIDRGGKFRIFVNNMGSTRRYTYTPSGVFNTNIAAVGIERVNNFNNSTWLTDEIAFFPFAPTEYDCRTLFDRGDSDLPNRPKSLYLKFDEGSGTTVADSSGNGRNFTLASATGAWIARPAEVTINRTIVDRTIVSRTLLEPIPSERTEFRIKYPNMGFNYGHDSLNGSNNMTVVNADLDRLFKAGVRKLRIAMSDYAYTAGVNACKEVALAAKARGFYVLFGVDHPGGFGAARDATWDAYVTNGILPAADWSQANGIDEFMLANELEYSQTVPVANPPGSLTDTIGKVKNVASAVSTRFLGPLFYNVGQDTLEAQWIAQGKGPHITHLAYNVYGSSGDFTDWKNKITTMHTAFGDSVFQIAEWNLNSLWSPFPALETDQAAAILERAEWLYDTYPNVVNYFFTYRWDDNGGRFAVRINNTDRLWFNSLFE